MLNNMIKKVVKKVAKSKKVEKKKLKIKKADTPATAKEKKEVLQMVSKVLDRKNAGFVMVTMVDESGDDRSRLIGNRISKEQILQISLAHLELNLLDVLMTASSVEDVMAKFKKGKKS